MQLSKEFKKYMTIGAIAVAVPAGLIGGRMLISECARGMTSLAAPVVGAWRNSINPN